MTESLEPRQRSLPHERPIEAIRLTGGRPCLDFVNTIHDRHALEPEDYVDTPERFIEWAAHAGLDAAMDTVPAVSTDRSVLMQEVAAFRLALHAIFKARIDRKPGPAVAIGLLDAWVHRAWSDLVLQTNGLLEWRSEAIDARLPLKQIALDALALLKESQAERLKICSAEGACGWLFFDTSKNNSRRWCAMETCGTADKMTRYRKGVAATKDDQT